MDSPISVYIAEVMQHIYNLITAQLDKILYWHRYIDDAFILTGTH